MSSRIEDLEPVTQHLCRGFLDAWHAQQLPAIRVTCTLRTLDEQMQQYQKGRRLVDGVWKVVAPRVVVSNAPPGSSPHNYGAAFDICFAGTDPYLHDHEEKTGQVHPLWDMVGEHARKAGLEWGGDWKRFKDRPHIQRKDWKVLRDGGGQ